MSQIQNVINRAKARGAVAAMRGSFEPAAEQQLAAAVGAGKVQIGGQLYDSTTNAAPGTTVTVINAGRPAAANYAASNAAVIMAAGAGGGGASAGAGAALTTVPSTRRIVTAPPLSGGGYLSADLTLSLLFSPGGRILSDLSGIYIDPAIAGTNLLYNATTDKLDFDPAAVGDGLIYDTAQIHIDPAVAGPGLLYTVGDQLTANVTGAIYLDGSNRIALKIPSPAGLEIVAGGVQIADSVAGAGIAVTNKVLSIDLATNPGLVISANKLALQTSHADNSVSASTTNSLTANGHRHAVIASDNPGAAASLLKSSAAGGLTLAALTITGSVVIDQSLSAADGGFYAGRYGSPGAYYTRVGINKAPTDDQFDLDVAGNVRTDGYFVGKHAIQVPAARAIFHFDGKDETDTSNGTPTSHRGHAPGPATETGTIRYTRGKFGKARDFVRQAVTNLQSEGGFETGSTAGFSSDSAGGAGYSKTITTEHVFEGSNALLIKLGATGTPNIYRNPLAISGSTAYAMTLLIKPVTSGASISGLTAFIGSTYFTPTVNNAGNGWYQVIVSGTSSASPSAVHGIAGLVNGETYAIDNFQLTAGAEAYAFTDIATTASVLGYPNLAPRWDAGSITMWLKAYGYAAGGAGLFGIGASLSQWDGYIVTDGRIAFRTSGTTLASTGTIQRGKWHHICMTWSSSGKRIYIDGILASSVGAYAYTPQTGNFYIGTLSGSLSNTANAAIDDFAIIDRAMDADEIRTIYESNAPIFGESATFQFRAGARIRVWADENGLFATSNANAAAFAIYNGAAPTFSWGGINLEDADVLIGDPSRGGALHWDNSANALRLDEADIAAWNGANQTVSITAAGAMKLGSNVSAAATTTFEHTTAGAVRFGATGSNKPNLYWDGSTLSLRNNTTPVIVMDNTGAAYFAGIVTVGSAGEIRQGTGTPGAVGTWSPAAWGSFTGLRIGADGSARGRIGGYNAGILQWYNDTDGKMYAGSGNIIIDTIGITARTTHNSGSPLPNIPGYSNVTTGSKVRFVDQSDSIWYGGANYAAYAGGEIGALAGSTTIDADPLYPNAWGTHHSVMLRFPDSLPKAAAPGYPSASVYGRIGVKSGEYELGLYRDNAGIAWPYFRDAALSLNVLLYYPTALENRDFGTGTGTGTKIATAASQKLSFHGNPPVIQRGNAQQTATATTGATNSAPYGYTTAAQANAIVTLVNELRAALVEKGIIKGSA